MSEVKNTAKSVVVTSSHGDYYVIPVVALEQFCASAEERERIDEKASAMVPGSFVRLKGQEASVQSSFASSPRTTLLAWLQNV